MTNKPKNGKLETRKQKIGDARRFKDLKVLTITI
jgi:hypothetical protein